MDQTTEPLATGLSDLIGNLEARGFSDAEIHSKLEEQIDQILGSRKKYGGSMHRSKAPTDEIEELAIFGTHNLPDLEKYLRKKGVGPDQIVGDLKIEKFKSNVQNSAFTITSLSVDKEAKKKITHKVVTYGHNQWKFTKRATLVSLQNFVRVRVYGLTVEIMRAMRDAMLEFFELVAKLYPEEPIEKYAEKDGVILLWYFSQVLGYSAGALSYLRKPLTEAELKKSEMNTGEKMVMNNGEQLEKLRTKYNFPSEAEDGDDSTIQLEELADTVRFVKTETVRMPGETNFKSLTRNLGEATIYLSPCQDMVKSTTAKYTDSTFPSVPNCLFPVCSTMVTMKVIASSPCPRCGELHEVQFCNERCRRCHTYCKSKSNCETRQRYVKSQERHQRFLRVSRKNAKKM